MKIFDCFTFFNEIELLDLRLMVLNDYVDYFVIVEANKTHTGKSKDFIFERNRDMFSDYINKIIYIKVEDLPNYSRSNIWIPENFQRNCIERGLSSAVTGDKIIVSDIDEIPNPEVFIQYLNTYGHIVLAQKLFYYYVNCLQKQVWTGAYITTKGYYTSLQKLREDALTILSSTAVDDGGWHYSYMGGAEKIKLKVENIAESHVIINKVGSISDITMKITSQEDLWGRTEPMFKKQLVDITEKDMAPICIDRFIVKYPTFYYGNR
jgi:beta-1,4-mannosyl-glycoprotein beta-1,4-N-acetylglucosaminyltransferase